MSRSTVITASAGTGKTYTLTHALADRVRGGVDASHLIATTFSVRAAAELTDRLRRTLLDDDLVDQAQAVDTALIGTVNSIAGRILTDYALDAGLAPELRILDEDEAKRTFGEAVDAVAADKERAARGLLSRLGHDGEEQTGSRPSRGQHPSWVAVVRQLTDLARENGLDRAGFERAAAESWTEVEAALDAAAGVRAEDAVRTDARPDAAARDRTDLRAANPDAHDPRPAWRARIGAAMEGLRTSLDAGDVPTRSIGPTEDDLVNLDATLTRLSRDDAPWDDWARLAAGKARTADGTSIGLHATAKKELEGLSAEIEAGLASVPTLRADVRGLIDLVLTTVADALDAYAAYKRQAGLLDFTDQLTQAYGLISGTTPASDRVRSSLAERYRVLAVDEFQDTNPIQLALFLELGTIVDEVIWVGDPKQAIYGFRGTDPAIMAAAMEHLVAQGGRRQTLSESWRSTRPPIEFTNAIFSALFSDLRPDEVRLTIPEQRLAHADRGAREIWRLAPPAPAEGRRSARATKASDAAGMARGVRDLITRRNLMPGDVAVLVRTGSERSEVAAALEAAGLVATTLGEDGHPLLAAREAQLVRAGLAVLVDDADTLALAELMTLLPEHGAHTDWYERLAAEPDRPSRRALLRDLAADPVLAPLMDLRRVSVDLTPREAVEAIAGALGVPERLKAARDPAARLGVLDALRALADTYEQAAALEAMPVTLTGFAQHLSGTTASPRSVAHRTAVTVSTMHGAKGLEWPAVVVHLGDREREASAFGTEIVDDGVLMLSHPLAHRSARYRPDVLAGLAPFRTAMAESDAGAAIGNRARSEQQRLLYVALTRARDVLVLASRDGVSHVLNASTGRDEPLVSWTVERDGPVAATIHGAEETVVEVEGRIQSGDPLEPVTAQPPRDGLSVRDAPGSSPGTGSVSASSASAPPLPSPIAPPAPGPAATPPSARFQASGVASEAYAAAGRPPAVTRLVRLGTALVPGGGKGWNEVGEAVHAFLATPHDRLSPARRQRVAERLVERWGVADRIGPDTLLVAGTRWSEFIARTFPGAVERTEQPITWWNEDSQVMEGWIDSLLETADGLVLVDHKTYPGTDPIGHIERNYLGQMETYCRALEAATGQRPRQVLMHLPLRGEVYQVG